jgi:glycosyltransferase involved in cell wall biosynthesis
MKVALVHDWLVTHRGGEKVLEAICELYPQADLFTLLYERGRFPPIIEQRRVVTSFLNRLPLARKKHRHFLPVFPLAIERFQLEGYELVISSSHCVAKGIRPPPGARHLSYVHAPMRYMWDLFDDYFGPGRASLPIRLAARAMRPALQAWDRRSAERVDRFVANSHHIAEKIQRLYGREASVVHPPVELERFARVPLEGGGQGGYFLWLGALAPYKRVDVAIEAFARLGLPLWIGGSGQEQSRVAEGLPANVRFLGQVTDDALPALYRDAKALIFTAEEDFGISPLEAQATGRPVIAFGRGGSLETVTPQTGLFFTEQTPSSLEDAVRRFGAFEQGFDPNAARAHAAKFTRARFQQELLGEVKKLWA